MNYREDALHPVLDYLQAQRRISEDMKRILLTELQVSGRPLDILLFDLGIMDEAEWVQIWAELRQCDYVQLTDRVDSMNQCRTWIPQEILERTCSIPISYDAEKRQLTVAMADVSDIQSYDLLHQYVERDYSLTIVLAKRSEIMAALYRRPELSKDLQWKKHLSIDDKIINQFLYTLIMQAMQKRASDIHFEPEKFLVRVRYRCDGLLNVETCFHHSLWQSLCVQIKVLSAMDIAETRKPQDGRFSMSVMGQNIDFRVATHPTNYGESIVLRLLIHQQNFISLCDLGYSAHNLKMIQRLLHKPDGLIVMTGPTGSGKTTSLYSMLSVLDKEQLNIMTLEEPIEYKIPGIRQSEVREGLDFATGVYSILRQDPDVILIGEIRDSRTADMAIRASMTGHLVFTTLHTTNALGTFHRLKELNISVSLLAGVLNGVVAQRLIRLLCVHCKKKRTLDAQEAQNYGIWPQVEVYEPVGCVECDFSGYRGRKAIAEVLTIDPILEEALTQNASYNELYHLLVHRGFRDIKSDGLDSVLRGETSYAEIRRVLGI